MVKWVNVYWWNYYWKAITLYQLHSPFLYDFAVRVLTSGRNSDLDKIRTNGKHQILEVKKLFPLWIIRLWIHYGVEYVYLDENDARRLELEMKGFPFSKTDTKKDFHPHRSFPLKIKGDEDTSVNDKITFQHLWLCTVDGIHLSKFKPTTSAIIILEGIHSNSEKYDQWKGIIQRSEFNFSIELYNFGVLFHHPVNTRPEHIALIPWYKKPWKIN